ncbi:M56 family metallopeptidase [Pedobacter borealis]|uniref:M56 family metallopeptidase n=1 Tax=Pedobacter borealis TaxID=475254 RepID=UPI000493A395|nr:M56 family metallopeptidase [Pedobacter borealis]
MEWLTYLLKVTACTVLFFGFYLLVLRKLTFFKINRFYLLATLLLSFIIPALQFEVKREIIVVETEAPVNIPEIKPLTQAPVQLIQPIMVKYQPEVKSKIDWVVVMYYVYGSTASLLLLACLWQLLGLLKYTGRYTKNSDGLKLITKTEGFTNCSFFNYVFINDADLSATDLSVLLKHEQVHARQYHSIDKIILMVFKAVLWFNPVVYLYDKALEQVHEYEADEITSTDYGNEAYANLLLKLAIAKSDTPLIHNFIKSPIKGRIKMLFNQKSKNMKKLFYVLALPILLGLVYGFTVKYVDVARSNKVESKRLHLDYSNGKWVKGTVVETSKDLQSSFFTLKTIDKIYTISSGFVDIKIKIGDELNVFVAPNLIPPPPIGEPDRFKKFENTYMPKAIKNMDGHIVFEYEDYHTWRKSAKYANLLSEANKIRGKKLNGIIEQVHYFGVAKIADGIILKVDEKFYRVYIEPKIMKTLILKPGENLGVIVNKVDVWQDSKYPVIIVEPKKLKAAKVKTKINEKPLQLIGSDKLKDNAKALGPVKPRIISFSKMTGDTKNKVFYMENAVIDITNCRLEAKYVELDQVNGKMIAKNGVLKANEGGSATAEIFVFNLKNGNYNAGNGNETFKLSKRLDADQ